MPRLFEDLTLEDIDEIKRLDAAEWKTNSIAARFGVQAHVIRRITRQKDAMPVTNEETDEDLGIGEGELPPAPAQAAAEEAEETVEAASAETAALTALLASPAMQAAIDAAVNARVAQLTTTPASAAFDPNFLAGFTQTIKHLIDTNAQQQPGYIRALPSEVVEERLAGKVEMDALIEAYRAANTPPHYKVGEGGFFECTNAVELNEGDELRTYLPPCESFQPVNAEARKVHAAMMQWIGGPSDEIGELVKQAQIDAKAPIIGSELVPLAARAPLIEIVPVAPEDRERRVAEKRRNTGTIVPDPIDMTGGRTGTAGVPSGPFA